MKKINVEMDEFPVILQSINELLCEPYVAVINVINKKVFKGQWNANVVG